MVRILSKLEAAAAGPVATPETPEAALARADAERIDAMHEREALIVRRAELLSTAGSDAEIEGVDLAIARVNRTIERRQMALPVLRAQAEAARRAQTETQFIADYAEFRRAQNDFLLSYRAAVETRARLAALIDAGAAKFPGRFLGFAAYPQPEYLTLEQTALAVFEADVERALAAEARRARGEW